MTYTLKNEGLYFTTAAGEKLTVAKGGTFALIADGDILLGHGDMVMLAPRYEHIKEVFGGNEIAPINFDLEFIKIPVAKINEAMLAEINKCIEIADYVGKFSKTYDQ